MSNDGKLVKVHYVGTLDNGEQFDSSHVHGQPLEFMCGAGQMIPGFDAAVKDMEVGSTINVHIPCADAYGEPREDLTMQVPLDHAPYPEDMVVGAMVKLVDNAGNPIPAKVVDRDDTMITLDLNHELAGQDLNFEIELISAE